MVGPGVFYGEAGNGFVRVALTGTDERIDAAVARLATQRRNNHVTRTTNAAFYGDFERRRLVTPANRAVLFK